MLRLVALSLVMPAVVAAHSPTMQVSPNLRMIPGLHDQPWVAVSPVNPDVLIASRNGTFHAVWLDRRSGPQELYSARITWDAAFDLRVTGSVATGR